MPAFCPVRVDYVACRLSAVEHLNGRKEEWRTNEASPSVGRPAGRGGERVRLLASVPGPLVVTAVGA